MAKRKATQYRISWRIDRLDSDNEPIREPYFGGATLSRGGPAYLLDDVAMLVKQFERSAEALLDRGQLPELEG